MPFKSGKKSSAGLASSVAMWSEIDAATLIQRNQQRFLG